MADAQLRAHVRQLVGAEMVTADGQVVRASEK